jgi:hypothetical protein
VVRTAAANGKHIIPPKGFYNRVLFRVTDAGSCVAMTDGHGNSYTAALGTGAWTAVNANWLYVAPSTPLATYQTQNRFIFNWSPVGGTSLTIEFDIDYYPAPDDAGWTMD